MMLRSVGTVLLVCMSFLSLSVEVAAAAQEANAPQVASFDFTPKTVDVTSSAQTVTITTRVTDETGVETSSIDANVSSQVSNQSFGFVPLNRISGDAKDGIYQGTVTLPTTATPGNWRVMLWPISDVNDVSNGFTTHPQPLVVGRDNTQTVPSAPTNPIARAGSGSSEVTWTAPTTNGGSPITGYTITSSPGGITKTVDGDQTTGTINGLTNGTSYTFTVVATNATGTSPASSPSNAVTPAAVPGAPTGVSAVKGDKSAVVSWTAPASNGGSAITGYTITSSPGGLTKTMTGDVTTGTITGLTNGTSYTFTVVATNATGTSPASSPSNAVTPAAPVDPEPDPEPDPVMAPDGPTDVKAKVKERKVVLMWKAPTTGDAPTDYRITSNKGFEKSLPAEKTKLVVRKLKPGKYKFFITSVNEAGVGGAVKLKVRIR